MSSIIKIFVLMLLFKMQEDTDTHTDDKTVTLPRCDKMY